MSREAFDAWALRNTSLPSAHEMAWAAWQAALAQPQSKPVAWIYPSALEKFQECETFAHVYSIKVGCPDEESVPLYATPQQAQPTGKAPCARHCEATAFQIEIRELKRALSAAPAVQPLSDLQLESIIAVTGHGSALFDFARAIEQAHGIAAPGSAHAVHPCTSKLVDSQNAPDLTVKPVPAAPESAMGNPISPMKPLTREQIDAVWSGMGSFTDRQSDYRLFARAAIAKFCEVNGIGTQGGGNV